MSNNQTNNNSANSISSNPLSKKQIRKQVKKEAKEIKEKLNAITKYVSTFHSESSDIHQLAIVKSKIDKFFESNQISDEVLLQLRSVLFRPNSINESARILMSVVIVDIGAVELFKSLIFNKLPDDMNWLGIILIAMLSAPFLIAIVGGLMYVLYKLPHLFENYNDKFDEYKIEAVDKLIKDREDTYRQQLNSNNP